MNIETRVHAVLDLLEGRATAGELASRFGVTEHDVETWRAAYLAGARGAVAPAVASRQHVRALAVGVAALASMALLVGSTRVFAQAGCAQTVPSGLVTFCADAPALAADVNGNFQKTIDYLTQKVGPTGTNIVTMGASLYVDGGITVRGNPVFTGTDLVLANPGRGTTLGRALVHDNGNALTVNYGNDYSGGVRIQSSASITGGLLVGGDLAVANNQWGSEGVSSEVRPTSNGALSYTNCSAGQFVCGVGVGHASGDSQYWTGMRLNVKCCAL